jgi:transcriptional regulator with XRE-family HTH domain
VNSEPLDALPLVARLRLLRTRLGLSQEQLARRLGVSFATVNRWESGRSRPSARARLAIAELEAAASCQEPLGDREAERGRDPERGPEPAEDRPGRLPIAQSSFVGRKRELAELAGLFTRSRLINLNGPGGVGKNRLAIEAAQACPGASRRWPH